MTSDPRRAAYDNDARADSQAYLRDLDRAARLDAQRWPTWGPLTITGCDCGGRDRHHPDCLGGPDRYDR